MHTPYFSSPDDGYARWDTGECGVVDVSKPGSAPHQVVNDDTVVHHAIRWRLTQEASKNDELLSPKEHKHEGNEVEVEGSICNDRMAKTETIPTYIYRDCIKKEFEL